MGRLKPRATSPHRKPTGNQCSVKPVRTDHGLRLGIIRPPQARTHQRESQEGGWGGARPHSTPPPAKTPSATEKHPNGMRVEVTAVGTEEGGDVGVGSQTPEPPDIL